MDLGEGAALAALGGFVTVVVTNVLRLWRARHGTKRVERKDVLEEWQDLLADRDTHHRDDLIGRDEHAERLESVISQQQVAIESLQSDNSDCREENAELRSNQHFLYDLIKRCHSSLRATGHDPGELPQMPKPRHRKSREAEFLARQAQASAQLSREVREVLPKPPRPSDPPPFPSPPPEKDT